MEEDLAGLQCALLPLYGRRETEETMSTRQITAMDAGFKGEPTIDDRVGRVRVPKMPLRQPR